MYRKSWKCENYTGISVTSTFSRIYGCILAKLVESEYKNMEMAGYV
jgi:hypothetical protein